MPDETTEIFDDLYLGLRAGGAMRKQRRGEPLTDEEQEALGRWQRLSTWRKAAAVGAFGVGTFGLGFTLGGLVFGRWRKALRRFRCRDCPRRGLSRQPLSGQSPFGDSPCGLRLGVFRREKKRWDFFLGGILVSNDDVHERDENRGDRHREQHVDAAEQQADRGDGDEDDER